MKKRIVTRATGTMDSLVVMCPAPVTSWSLGATLLFLRPSMAAEAFEVVLVTSSISNDFVRGKNVA